VKISNKWVWAAVVALLAVQAAQMAYVVHRESLTWDEDDHIFAGYMMLHTSDYGLNPEHPPLVKMLAALPLLGRNLWTPPLQGRNFKAEAYLGGRDFLARNDGGGQRLVFQMRLMAGLLALGLSLLVFLAARETYRPGPGLPPRRRRPITRGPVFGAVDLSAMASRLSSSGSAYVLA